MGTALRQEGLSTLSFRLDLREAWEEGRQEGRGKSMSMSWAQWWEKERNKLPDVLRSSLPLECGDVWRGGEEAMVSSGKWPGRTVVWNGMGRVGVDRHVCHFQPG